MRGENGKRGGITQLSPTVQRRRESFRDKGGSGEETAKEQGTVRKRTLCNEGGKKAVQSGKTSEKLPKKKVKGQN